jgi:heme-degrading monooxygenase HmoA
MYSTMLTVRLQHGTTPDAIRILQEEITPVLKGQQGFRAAYLVGSPDADKVIYLTFWETKSDISRMDNSGIFERNMAQFALLFAAPPEREIYEVLAEI